MMAYQIPSDTLSALRNVGGVPFYRLRNGKNQRHYLFSPKYSRVDTDSLPPEGTSGIRAQQPIPMDNMNMTYSPDVEQMLFDSEELTRLPSHLEQLFCNPSMMYSQQQDAEIFPLYHPRSQDAMFMSSTSARPSTSDALVPVELLMYNDLMGCQIMDYSPMNGARPSEDQGPGWLAEDVETQPNGVLNTFGAGTDNLWSSVPTGLGLVQFSPFARIL